uniref:Uncharacterized protein n=1 Tax=Anguilla anguilla TaxID=7936 RepID=A0A0E9TTW6_ANGAN
MGITQGSSAVFEISMSSKDFSYFERIFETDVFTVTHDQKGLA